MYYHCTHKNKTLGCNNRVWLTEQQLIELIADQLGYYTLPQPFIEYAKEYLDLLNNNAQQDDNKDRQYCRTDSQDQLKQQISRLTQMRSRDLLTDEEYITEKHHLENEIVRLDTKGRQSVTKTEARRQALARAIEFADGLKSRFLDVEIAQKNEILIQFGQNHILNGKNLSIRAKYPLRDASGAAHALCADLNWSELTESPLNKGQKALLAPLIPIWQAELSRILAQNDDDVPGTTSDI